VLKRTSFVSLKESFCALEKQFKASIAPRAKQDSFSMTGGYCSIRLRKHEQAISGAIGATTFREGV